MTEMSKMRLATYDVQVDVRTPLHVGSGAILQNKADYVVEPGQVRILDVEAALERMSDAEIARAHNGLIATALDVEARGAVTRRLVAYDYDAPAPDQIRAHMELADGTPYLPGSSLKGALRTALLARLVEADGQVHANSRHIEARARVDALEHQGADQNRDMLRLLRVSDLVPVNPRTALMLVRAQAQKVRGDPHGIPIWCLALRRDTRLRGTLTIEQGSPLFQHLAADQRDAITGFLSTLAAQAVRVARYEREAYAEGGARAPDLFKQIEQGGGKDPRGRIWCQIGWGGGWHTKTVATALSQPAWEDAAQQALAARGGALGGVPHPFPSTRRVVEEGELPFGWTLLSLAPRRARTGRAVGT